MTEHPGLLLAHLRDVGDAERKGSFKYGKYWEWTNTYGVQPIDVPRPRTGMTRAKIQCLDCGDIVPIDVFSNEKTQRVRRNWLIVSIIGWTLVILISPYSLYRFFESGEEDFQWLITFAISFVGFMTPALTGYRKRQQEEGVRVHDPQARFMQGQTHSASVGTTLH
ncbi:hypothetical protein ACIREO_16670 [Streptomyces sp. NPDC102441]|uniref:hypothetical protein n=1 Tax=Streptomyces sp. NPDC102441 TaxID=3366176 RepID=UPI003814EDFE